MLVDHRADAVMHFAAWLAVGESVRKPLEYYQNNVAGTLRACSRRCATPGVHALRVLVDLRRLRRAGRACRSSRPCRTQPINAYGETKLAIERALPHLERAHGLQVDRAALLQRRRRASRRHDRRGSRARDSPDPAGHSRRDRRHAAAGVRRGLSDARRHLPARLHPRLRPGRRRTCARWRRSSAGARQRAYNVGTGTPHSVREVIDTVSRVVGRAGGVGAGAAAPRRPGGALCRRATAPSAELGWRRAIARPRDHRPARVAVACEPIRRGYTRDSPDARHPLMDAFLRLLRYAAPHRAVIAGAALAMMVYGAASAALAWLIKPIIDEVLPARSRPGLRRRGASWWSTSSRASARTSPAT